jgi:hypothetical protein
VTPSGGSARAFTCGSPAAHTARKISTSMVFNQIAFIPQHLTKSCSTMMQQSGQRLNRKPPFRTAFWFALWHRFGTKNYRGGMPQRWVGNYYYYPF